MNLKHLLIIFRKEIYALATSSMAYVFTFFFLFLFGLFFYMGVVFEQQNNLELLFSNFAIIGFMIFPLLAVKLIAEEKKMKTLPLLYASPINILEIVLGKYLSLIAFILVLLLATSPLVFYLNTKTPLYFPEIFLQYFSFALFASTLCSIGLLSSSLTGSQNTAAILAFAISLGLFFISWLGSALPPTFLKKFFAEITLLPHFSRLNEGLLSLKDILYFLIFITAALLLTIRKLENSKWRGV